MSIRIAVVSLWAENVPETAHFYRDVIGLPLQFQPGHSPHFDLGGCYLVVMRGTPSPPQNTHPERFPIFALSVDDLDEAVERLRRHSVELPWGIEGSASSRFVMFYDPAGNLIELTGK